MELQDQNFNLYQVDVKVRTRVQIFEERRTVPGNYYDCAAIDANDLSCEGVEVRNNDHECDPRIDPAHFSLNCPATMTPTLLTGLVF